MIKSSWRFLFVVLGLTFVHFAFAEEEMRCVRVGYGTISSLHEQKLKPLGVKTVGVLDTDLGKKAKIASDGYRYCETYADAIQLHPDFWDVCTPSSEHLSTIEKIILVDPRAYILVEKPICLSDQVEKLQSILQDFRGKIVVNENYLSSEITKKVKEIAFEKMNLQLKRIVVEMDKNRTQDFKRGRYLDEEGALKYEGPHMLTILCDIGPEFAPLGVVSKRYEDVEIPDRLKNQGLADIFYNVEGVEINLFSSMKGDVKNIYEPFKVNSISESDTVTRYRIIAIEGVSEGDQIAVVGFYEPINGFDRSQGAVAVLRNGHIEFLDAPIEDDTMGKHIQKAVGYFRGVNENPCPVEEGLEVVKMLELMLP